MDVSARTLYGLRALVTLAGARSQRPMSIQAIADEEGLPGKFLEDIMVDLKRGGFVRSKRGANGGYLLARPASEISLLDAIEHLDGPISPHDPSSAASEGSERNEAFVPVWEEIRDAMRRVLLSYSIQSIADSVLEIPQAEFKPNYQI